MMYDFFIGLLLVIIAGVLAGSSAAPIKVMRRFRYEHWALISVLIGMLVMPWTIMIFSVDIGAVLTMIPMMTLIKANLLSLAWGIANVMAGLCLIRIGFSLSVSLLTGVGMPIGVLMPMIFRGSGLFADTPPLFSRPGAFIVLGVVVMLLALALIAMAGFGKADHAHQSTHAVGFKTGFLMALTAGVLQAGLSFAFVYCQGPINDSLRANNSGAIGLLVGVWAFVLPGGLLINLGYIIWRLSYNKNWSEFLLAPGEIILSVLIGIAFLGFVVALGVGMQMMGALGASIGFGVYQTMQVASSQTVGVLSGEWKGVPAKPKKQMFIAMLLLLIAVIFFSAGKL